MQQIFTSDLWHYLTLPATGRGGGMPDTYPRPLDGFMVCGGPSAGEEGHTYPAQLEEELRREVGYRPVIKGDPEGGEDSPWYGRSGYGGPHLAAGLPLERYPATSAGPPSTSTGFSTSSTGAHPEVADAIAGWAGSCPSSTTP